MINCQIKHGKYNLKPLWHATLGIIFTIFFVYGFSFASERKKVLYISSYHPGFPTFFQQVEGIKTVFDKHGILFDIEFMDTKRFSKKHNWALFQKLLTYKLELADPYSAIMVADDNALIFALEQQTKLFKGIPIVFLGVNNMDLALKQNNNPQITGVVESVSMEETIELMIKLRPKANNISALVDNTSSGQGDLKSFYQIAKKFDSHKFSDLSLSQMAWPDFLNALSGFGEDRSVLLLSAYQDKNEKTLLFDESLRQIKERLSEPVFHLWHHGLGDGILGGKIISHTEQGKTAANIVLQILNGKPSEQIKVFNLSPNQYTFDYNELKKYNLHNSQLPKNSIILNEPHSFYQENKSIIWAVAFIITVLSLSLFFAIINIYRRKKVEQVLKSREVHLRTLIETIPDLIWLKDVEGVYLSCNLKFERFFGAKETEIVGKTDYDFVDKDAADSFRKKDKIAMAAGKPSMNEEKVTYADDGHSEILETIKTPMYGADGQLVGVLGVARDITNRKKEEEEKIRLRTELQHAQKMESVGRLAGGVAHDFNNMLSIILGNTELLVESMGPSNPATSQLNEIYKAAVRSSKLTQQLLAFARKQTVAPEVINFNEAIEGMLNMLSRLIGEDIELIWLPSKTLRPIKIDPSQVDQVLANLCVNARDAIKSVGKVTIETRNVDFDAAYCKNHAGFKPGEYVMMAFSDNGSGMDKVTLDIIFEPFFSTKELGKGTGLGLATVYGIVKQNNGFINVYSEVGQGTTFKIYFPRHKQSIPQVETTDSNKTAQTGNETILLVEDETVILSMTAKMLEGQGYTVLPAATPGEAFRIADEAGSNNIHLLLTDVVMPEMNGRDLSKKILQLYPDIKCLFMSGYTSNVIAHHGVLDQGVEFINKPFSKQELSSKIRDILDRPFK